MIIPKMKIPLYGIIIVLSIFIGMLYIYLALKKNKNNKKEICYYYMIYIVFAIICGKMYTLLIYGLEESIWEVGLSAYGGLIGVVIGSIIFEKIVYCKKEIIKYTILSLPLVYGLTKIACFISGCCTGIPYNGPFKVIYRNGLNIGQFPIQIVETIVSLLLFYICHKNRNKKNITYITLILVSIIKFLLDFLRYEHIKIFLSRNQIFSIFLIITIIIIRKYRLIDKIKFQN
ncbi:MAG: prolipoprotein diacylglyceryl transferase family protein [Bacilli bacterium]|nr:prolipoprotein diacylglyceryl transferase family protein [Bacilli bacterium]